MAHAWRGSGEQNGPMHPRNNLSGKLNPNPAVFIALPGFYYVFLRFIISFFLFLFNATLKQFHTQHQILQKNDKDRAILYNVQLYLSPVVRFSSHLPFSFLFFFVNLFTAREDWRCVRMIALKQQTVFDYRLTPPARGTLHDSLRGMGYSICQVAA